MGLDIAAVGSGIISLCRRSVCTWTFSTIKFQADMGILLAFMFIWNMIGTLFVMPALVFVLGEPTAVKRAAFWVQLSVQEK